MEQKNMLSARTNAQTKAEHKLGTQLKWNQVRRVRPNGTRRGQEGTNEAKLNQMNNQMGSNGTKRTKKGPKRSK